MRRRYVMRVVQRLVARQGRRQPLVMIIEDMQWVDSETHARDGQPGRGPAASLVALAPTGPESPTAGARTPASPRSPRALDAPAHRGGCSTRSLGTDPALGPAQAAVADRANGNPLFLEECVRPWPRPGPSRASRGPTASRARPSRSRSADGARHHRLSHRPARYEDKRLLQAASVIGDEVPMRLLEAVADVPAEEVRRGVEQLEAGGLLDRRALFPDLVYGFRHALVHDVTYDSLLHDRRRSLHARILEAIEHFYAGRLAEQTERLAHHAFLGEVWDRALGYCREAGVRTLARMASWEKRLVLRACPRRARPPARGRGPGGGPALDLTPRWSRSASTPAAWRCCARRPRSPTARRPAATRARAIAREQRALGHGSSDEAARVGEASLAIAEASDLAERAPPQSHLQSRCSRRQRAGQARLVAQAASRLAQHRRAAGLPSGTSAVFEVEAQVDAQAQASAGRWPRAARARWKRATLAMRARVRRQ